MKRPIGRGLAVLRVGAILLAILAAGPLGAAEVPKMRAYVLGKPDQPAPDMLRSSEAGACTVKAVGRDAYGHMDEGVFAGFETDAPAFTLVARISKGIEGGASPKFGLVVRAGLAGNDKAVALRYDGYQGNRCLQWFMRYHVVGSTHQGSGRCFVDGTDKRFAAPAGLWLKLVRRYPYIDMYASLDGQAWERLAYQAVLLPGKVWAGLQVTAGGAEGASAAFDNIRFTVDDPPADAPSTFKEYTPPQKYTVYFAKVNLGAPDAPAWATAYAIVPDGTDPKAMRCFFWTPGSKEIALAGGGTLAFRSGAKDTPEAGLRLPADFDRDEGAYHTDRLDTEYAMWGHCGVLRLGTLHHAYHESLKRLAEVSGVRQLANLPFVSTGNSAAGGSASAAARQFPEFAVATAPCLIGSAGIEDVAKVPGLPLLFLVGSQDGSHLSSIKQAAPLARQHHAVWGSAPMWTVHHHPHKQRALMYPYFADCVGLRVPKGHDFASGPAKLKSLREEDGWLGLMDTWQTNFPKAVPFKEFKGDLKNTVWLPTERVARAWQAFVSYNPRTVIHFPMFEGHNTSGQAQPNDWHNSDLAADEPFEIAASGPLGEGLKVEYYFDAHQPLAIARQDPGRPYRVTAKGLPPGLHVLYAVTRWDGQEEISRPVSIMFFPRRK